MTSAPRDRTILVHLGMNKTGSRALQVALAQVGPGATWQFLSPVHRNASHVVQNAYDGTKADHNLMGGTLPQEKAHRRVVSELERLARPMGIISGEGIGQMSASGLGRFHDDLSRYAGTVRATAYVRPPLSFVTSNYQQRLRQRFLPPEEAVTTTQVRYAQKFGKFDRIFGEENVVLVPYERSRLIDGDTVADFFSRWGIAAEIPGDATGNASMSGEAARLLFHYRSRHRANRFHRDRAVIDALYEVPGDKFAFAPELFETVRPLLSAQIAWAAERMDFDMTEEIVAQPRAVRDAGDMFDLLPETIEWLGQKSGRRASGLMGDREAITDALERLGRRRWWPW